MQTSTAIAHNFALHLVVDDVDRSITWYQRALGATVTRILRLPDGSVATADLDIDGLDEFWGVRTAEVLDPSEHRWAFNQPVRELSNEEIEQRLAELVRGH